MFRFALMALLWTGCCARISSPLARIHPEPETARQWLEHLRWLEQHLTDNITEILQSSHDFLISDAMQQFHIRNASTECIQSLVHFGYDSMKRKKYTLQVDDADGKPGSGIFLGNILWNGRYYECKKVHGQYFDGKWCSLNVGARVVILNDGNTVGATLGLCLPKQCSEEYFNERLIPLANRTGVAISVVCPTQPSEKWSAADVLSVTIFCIIGAFVVIGTVLELITAKPEADDDSIPGLRGSGIYFTRQKEVPKCMKAFIAFSLYKNSKSLFNTERRADTLHVLHGIRFFSMAWVVLAHCYVMPLLYIQNFVDVAEWYNGQFTFQILSNASFAVDNFFFISGLLVAYLGFKSAEKHNGRLNAPKMYIMRYFRLTPPYAALLLLLVGFYGKLGDGPMWPDAVNGEKTSCQTYWWTNLLYINNFYPSAMLDECFLIGWYLANDMQFFILAPISIWLIHRRPKIGLVLILFGIFSSVLVTGILSSHFSQLPQVLAISQILKQISGATNNSELHEENGLGIPPPGPSSEQPFWSDLYTKPWCRISVYLIGMLTGYLLHVTKGKLKMSKVFVAIGWIVSLASTSVVIFGLWRYLSTDEQMPISLAAFYNAMSRVIWAIAMAWVVIACVAGYGGPAANMLSWTFWIPLSRLTYCMYLVHSLVILWLYATKEVPGNFSNKEFIATFLGALVMSAFVAYLFSMMFEAPVISLMRMAFPKPSEKDGEGNRSLFVVENAGEGNSGLEHTSGDEPPIVDQKQQKDVEMISDA